MSEPAVRIEGLTKVYASRGRVTAVQDVSLSIGRGEIFGLLGPNGAGKTTMVRIICGLIAPTAGTVHVDGLLVQDQPDAVRSRIGQQDGVAMAQQQVRVSQHAGPVVCVPMQ